MFAISETGLAVAVLLLGALLGFVILNRDLIFKK